MSRDESAAAQDHVCGPDCQCGCEAGLTIPVRRPSTAARDRQLDGCPVCGGPCTDERCQCDPVSVPAGLTPKPFTFTLPLAPGRWALMQLPSRNVTAEEWEQLHVLLEAFKPGLLLPEEEERDVSA